MYFQSSVPVAPGSWHSGGADGPARAAAIGQQMNLNSMKSWKEKYGGRFDHNQYRRAMAPDPRPAYRRPAPMPMSGLSNSVTTGIQPSPLYSPAHMQRMSNRAFGEAMGDADARIAQKAMMGRGLSLDQGTLASVTPQIANATSRGLAARHMMPLADQLRSQDFLLQGQQMQGREFLGLADLLRSLQQNGMAQQQMAMGPLLRAAFA